MRNIIIIVAVIILLPLFAYWLYEGLVVALTLIAPY